MSYTSYLQIVKDINYAVDFDQQDKNRLHSPFCYEPENYVDYRIVKKLMKIWLEHVKEEYEVAQKVKSALSKFLRQYPLPFKEFCCLLDLVEDTNEKSDFEIENRIREVKDIFKKHKVRFESSRLKRYKLVFKIVDPMRPLKVVYEVSYKAQLGLKNQRYTDEYEQLDLALEEESKRNSPDELDSLYYIIEPKESFRALIATPKVMDSLRYALSRELEKHKIFKTWGFGKVIQYGKGTTLNFRGPPGTGKTLAANCLAKELGRKLLMVRYDQLQNCYVGGTEKHIQKVFHLARLKNAVLFFDEADAIALSRISLVRSWEMSQVNTLLKELERFDGVCIFATNFSEKYDAAFERRLTMHIDFEMPTKEHAVKIIDKVLPMKARDKNLSLEGFDLSNMSGGDIKNVALNAAGIATKNKSDKIKYQHIKEAIQLVKSAKTPEKTKDNSYIS